MDTEGPTSDDPPETYRDLGIDQGRQGGANGRGTRRRKQVCGAVAQRQSAEDGRWRVKKNSRWAMIHSGRGFRGSVRESGESTLKATARRGAVGGGGTG